MVTTQTTSLEKQSLEAHVDLCAIRYQQLDLRLTTLEHKMDRLQEDLLEGSKSLKGVIIGAAATVVASMMSIVVALLMKF